MATTYTLIKTYTLSSNAATIDFTSIPNTYTDICLRYSLRTNATFSSSGYYFSFSFNGLTTNLNSRIVFGQGSSASSANYTTDVFGWCVPSDWTASSFSNSELYIPNYAGSNYKSMSIDQTVDTTSSLTYTILQAGLWSSSAAINRITLTPTGGSFVTYSTASLYGILKA